MLFEGLLVGCLLCRCGGSAGQSGLHFSAGFLEGQGNVTEQHGTGHDKFSSCH